MGCGHRRTPARCRCSCCRCTAGCCRSMLDGRKGGGGRECFSRRAVHHASTCPLGRSTRLRAHWCRRVQCRSARPLPGPRRYSQRNASWRRRIFGSPGCSTRRRRTASAIRQAGHEEQAASALPETHEQVLARTNAARPTQRALARTSWPGSQVTVFSLHVGTPEDVAHM